MSPLDGPWRLCELSRGTKPSISIARWRLETPAGQVVAYLETKGSDRGDAVAKRLADAWSLYVALRHVFSTGHKNGEHPDCQECMDAALVIAQTEGL